MRDYRNTSKWWSRAATYWSWVAERSFPEKRLPPRQPKKTKQIPQRVLETKSPKQEMNKRMKVGGKGQSCKGQFPFPKPLAVLLSVLCADCCFALPCYHPRLHPPLGNLVCGKVGEGNLDALNYSPPGKFDDGRAYMGGTSHGDRLLLNETWAEAYADAAATAAAWSPLPDSGVAVPTLDVAPVMLGITGGGGVGWAKVGLPTCFNYVYLLILLVCGMENPRSQKKRKTKKRPKVRHTHVKRHVPHRSFGPCKWRGGRRFSVKFKMYRFRGQLKRRRILHIIRLARSRRPVQNKKQQHAISSITWFSQVVRWVCGWLGIRVGEASHPGPAGSRTTKRKAEQEGDYHDDTNLAQTLLAVLQNYQGQQDTRVKQEGPPNKKGKGGNPPQQRGSKLARILLQTLQSALAQGWDDDTVATRLVNKIQRHTTSEGEVQRTVTAPRYAATKPLTKEQIGLRLHSKIIIWCPEAAGKIVGMLLEMPEKELLPLLESDDDLWQKVQEAQEVLKFHSVSWVDKVRNPNSKGLSQKGHKGTGKRQDSAQVQRNSRFATGFCKSEWIGDPVLTTLPQIEKALSEGQEVPGNLVITRDPDVSSQLISLWNAYDLNKKWKLTVATVCPTQGFGPCISIQWASGKAAQHSTQRLQVKTTQVGTLEGPKLSSPVVTQIPKLQGEKMQTVRLLAPAFYRRFMPGAPTEDTPVSVISAWASFIGCQTAHLTGGNWQAVQHAHGRILIGHVRVSPVIANKLVAASGRQALFATIADKTAEKKSVVWFPKEKLDNESYFRKVLTQGQSQKVPLAIRQGGASDLGLVGVNKGEFLSNRPRLWEFYGTPKHWEAADVVAFLTANGWRDVVVKNKFRRERQFIWLFQALNDVASETDKDSFHYTDDQGTLHLSIGPLPPATPRSGNPKAHDFHQCLGSDAAKRVCTPRASQAPKRNFEPESETLHSAKLRLRGKQHRSDTQTDGNEVDDCQNWNQVQICLQAISQGIPDQGLNQNSLGTLQACLLACSAIMRLIHAAMEKASDPEISLGRGELVRDTEPTEKPKEPDPEAIAKKRTKQVPKTEEEKKAISERFSWACNLCDYTFSASCYGTWVSKKSRHIERCHKNEKHLIADRRSHYPLVEVSNIKWDARHWTCSRCGLGLPWLPESQLARSRDAHMKQCAPDLTPDENRRILQNGQSKLDIEYRMATRKKTGWHSVEWRKERVRKAKEQGHELCSFVPAEGLLKTHTLRYSCKFCKRVQGETDCFTREVCFPRKHPKGHVWRTLRTNYDKFIGDLVKIWGWGQQEVKEMDDRMNHAAANPRKKTHKPLPKLPSPGKKTWYRALPISGTQHQKAGPQETEWVRDLCQEGIEPNPGPGPEFTQNLTKDHGPEPQSKTWTKDLCAEGVEPNPGPRVRRTRSSALDIVQININGRNNLWNLSQHFHTFGVDVICIQETHMNPQEQAQFAQSTWKKGWVTFGITTASKRGVLTLVRKHWKSKILYQLDQSGGQCLAVQVGHVCVINLYAAHDRNRETCTAQVFEFLQSMNPSPWVLTGDFNAEPHESPLALGLQACGFFFCLPPQGVSSRWEGERVIDYGISNCPFKHMYLDMMPEKWSDHRLCRMSIISPGMNSVNEQFEVVPTNRYQPQCSEMFGDWTEQLLSGWAETKEEWDNLCFQCEQQVNQVCNDQSQEPKQEIANEIWNRVNVFLECFLQKEAARAVAQGIQMHYYKKPQRKKGTCPRIRKVPISYWQPYPAGTPNTLRTWQKLWGRLLELERQFQHQGNLASAHLEKLRKKVRRCNHYQEGMTAAQAAVKVDSLLQQEQTRKLTAWRDRLRQNTAEVYRWVRNQPATPSVNIFDDELDPDGASSRNAQEALQTVKTLWRRVWDRTSDTTPTHQYLAEFDGPKRELQQWEHVSAKNMFQAAVAQKNKAAGPDGWSGTEVALFPFPMWQDLTRAFVWWERLESFPEPWQNVFQVHIEKSRKLRPEDLALPASKLRPISLMSCFWRIYIQARFSGGDEQHWLDNHLHHSQHGGRKKHDSAVAFTLIAERYAMGDYVGTLDLTRAFDHVDPQIAIDTLDWYGCPSFLTKGIAMIWKHQKRFLKWRKDVLPEGQDVRSSIPQGDGLSPRVMNLLLSATVKDIAAKEPETRVVVFMDDRSWASSTWHSFCHVWNLWCTHANHLGLRDNPEKSQFTHKRLRQREFMRSIEEVAPGVVDHLCALGAHLGHGPPQPKETERFSKAMACAAKIRAAPVAAHVRSFVASSAAAMKAAYGWLARRPIKKLRSPLDSMLKKAGFDHRMASKYLVKLVLGHCLDLEFYSGMLAVVAVLRHVARVGFQFRDWAQNGGPAKRIRNFMKDLKWQEKEPWVWWHDQTQQWLVLTRAHNRFVGDPSLCAHKLREAWRCYMWDEYLKSGRHEVAGFANMPYDSFLGEIARKQAKKKPPNLVGVLCGAFVSPEMASRMQDLPQESCPWCHCTEATFNHVCWECVRFPGEKPQTPENAITKRLGWGDESVLSHLGFCRQAVLKLRWD